VLRSEIEDDMPPTLPPWLGLLDGAIGPLATAVLAYLVGNRLTAYWTLRQKQRELTLAASAEFFRLYGEFFASWKIWSRAVAEAENGVSETRRWKVLERAAEAEGHVESLLVKMASERQLSNRDVEVLGKFRQAYQQLRKSIKRKDELNWGISTHREYIAFKRLATLTARLIVSRESRRPRADEAERSLVGITSNYWETRWTDNVTGNVEIDHLPDVRGLGDIATAKPSNPR
jgi:hypothetical protein